MDAYVSDFFSNPDWLREYPLWLAGYTKTPAWPKPWSTYNFWQYSGSAKVDGIGNPADVDYFNGDKAELIQLINSCIV